MSHPLKKHARAFQALVDGDKALEPVSYQAALRLVEENLPTMPTAPFEERMVMLFHALLPRLRRRG